MKAKRYKIDVYVTLYPPKDVDEVGQHGVALVKTILLDFVPYAGLALRFEGNYSEQEVTHWGSLMKASAGPDGAFGRGFNHEIWLIDCVFYNVAKERFEVSSYPELLAIEQVNALQELLLHYHGFRLLYPHSIGGGYHFEPIQQAT